MNTITITGNLVRDAKTIKKDEYTYVALRLANRYMEVPMYVDVLICGCAVKYAIDTKKGAAVLVSGRLHQRDYMDKDGNKRVAYSVVAYEFEKLDHAQNANGDDDDDVFGALSF